MPILGFTVLGLCGCPTKPTPPAEVVDGAGTATVVTVASAPTDNPTAAPTAEEVVMQPWLLRVRSDNPSLDPELFDTPEKRAKAFFDHEAKAEGGRIRVAHKSLERDWQIEEPKAAAELDRLVSSIDWAALAERVAAEEPSEGGTQFHFAFTRGERTVEIETTNVGAYPELPPILDALKAVTGAP